MPILAPQNNKTTDTLDRAGDYSHNLRNKEEFAMQVKTKTISTNHGATCLQGHLFSKRETGKPRPAVIVCHAWAGCDSFARSAAEQMVDLGYVGFAADLYGEGRVGTSKEENTSLMQPLVDDRALLRERLLTIFEAVQGLEEVDADRIAVIGYCFGGLCALDLARSGCPVAATISFHGLLSSPNSVATEIIPGKVLVLHGHLDPMVSEEEITALKKELTTAGADWQLSIYGQALHAFTNPEANDPDFGTVYDPAIDRRSKESLKNLLAESFGED
jgi:dienelactone hydrolase